MSYDLVFDSATELARTEVRAALAEAFGTSIRLDGTTLLGPEFSLAMADRATQLHVNCTWEVVRSPQGRALLAALRFAGCDLLGAACTNPQSGVVRPASRKPGAKGPRIVAPLAHPSMKITLDGDQARVLELTIRDEATVNEWHVLLAKQLQQPRVAALHTIKIVSTMVAGGQEADEAGVQAIAEAPHVTALREVWLNAYDAESACTLAAGNVTRILTAATGLVTFGVTADTLILRPFEHTALERLKLRWLASTQDVAGAVLRSTLPALTTLDLTGEMTLDPEALRGFLARAPKLDSIRLRGTAATTAVVAAIDRGRRAERLALTLERVDDAVARQLLEQHSRHPTDSLELTAAACSDELALAIEKAYGTAARVDHPAIAARRRAMASAAKSASYAVRAQKNADAGKLPGPQIGTRVKHATFGAGTVHARVGADKLEITFDDGTDRVLLLRFVTEV